MSSSRGQVPGPFGRQLRLFRQRRGVTQAILADSTRKRISQSQLSMWESGVRPAPSRSRVHILAEALGLDAAETRQLYEAAGFIPHLSAAQAQAIHVQTSGAAALLGSNHAPYCRVFSYQYRPTNFPYPWDARILRTEESVTGDLALMVDYIPDIMHSRMYYRHSYHSTYFPTHLLDVYVHLLDARRAALDKRLTMHTVRHIYSLAPLENYQPRNTPLRHPVPQASVGVDMPRIVVQEQLDRLLAYTDSSNFHLGLTRKRLPNNVEIVGDDAVLLEVNRAWESEPPQGVVGIEMRGHAVARQYLDQFNAIWNDEYTMTAKAQIRSTVKRIIASLWE